MKVSEIPFEELQIGDRCVAQNGTQGAIIGLHPEGIYGKEVNRYNAVSFKWDNGNISQYFFHEFACEVVEYIGRE